MSRLIDTIDFNTSALSNSSISTLNLIIYVSDSGNPPTLAGSTWGASYATIIYEQA